MTELSKEDRDQIGVNFADWQAKYGVGSEQDVQSRLKKPMDDAARRSAEAREAVHPTITPKQYVWIDPKTRPPRQWLYGKFYIRKFVSATFAPGGLGKTALTIVEAVSMAIGRDLLNGGAPIPKRKVWYLNPEDPVDELERRTDAVLLHYGINAEELGGRLFIAGRKTPVVIVNRDEKGNLIASPIHTAICDAADNAGIDVLIIDPFVTCHNLSENDNSGMNFVTGLWRQIAEEVICSVGLVHHVRKPQNGMTSDFTVNDGRGAGAVKDGARVTRVLNGMNATEAAKCGISAARKSNYFRVDDGDKQNLRPALDARWYQHVNVPLGNATKDDPQDEIGVVASWTPPSPMSDVSFEDELRIFEKVQERAAWRKNSQSLEWIGYAIASVLDLDVAADKTDDEDAAAKKKMERQKIGKIIEALLKRGVIVKFDGQDAKRMPREMFKAGRAPSEEPL